MPEPATSPEAVSESLWTVAETAHALHISQTTVYRMAVREELPSVKIGRVLRFVPAEIERWLWERARGVGKDACG